MDPRIVAIVAFMAVLQVPLSTWKWARSLRQHELQFPGKYLLRVCSSGFFLNNFLPTGVGGDAYRILKTLPNKGRRSRAVSAAVFDRAVGLIALMAIAYVSTVTIYHRHEFEIVDRFYLPLTAVLLAMAMSTLVLPRIGGLRRLLSNSQRLTPLADNLRLLLSRPANLVYILLLAILYQLMAISMIYLLFAATGQPVDFAVCAIITAVGGVLIMLPISVAGLGVYEGALVGSAVLFGVELQAAIAASLSWRLLTTMVSLSCGIAFLLPDSTEQRDIEGTPHS